MVLFKAYYISLFCLFILLMFESLILRLQVKILIYLLKIIIVIYQFSRSVVSDSLRPRGPQHTRPPCPSPTPEFTQTHVHWVGDAIQPSHPLWSTSPLAFNLSQHPGLFKRVSSSRMVAKVLEFQLQHQSFQWIFRSDFLYDGLVGSPCSPRDSQESSPTPPFKNINSLVLSLF